MPPAKRTGSASSTSSGQPAIANALLVTAALVAGTVLLVQRRQLTWPPYALLSSLSTIAGCLALVGPIILARSGNVSGSLGELGWLTAGLLVWLFDITALLQGQWRSTLWATPLPDRSMGLFLLAVLLAGWKCGLADRNWAWTNVAGWLLCLFWVTSSALSWILPATGRGLLAAR
jgi:hypothetical protein